MATNPIPPTKAQRHLEEAKKNFIGYKEQLKTTNDKDWGVVRLFYSALHLVQAYAESESAKTGEKAPRSHEKRSEFIATHLLPIAVEYERLEQASKGARYYLVKLEESAIVEIHDTDFNAIRQHLKSLGFAW
jgi:hypothetical protein